MDNSVRTHGRVDPPTDEIAWRSRLEENRATTVGLRQDTARVSDAIAATERAVAATLRRLAVEDRGRGRTASAERREARAEDAERFAALETEAAGQLSAPSPKSSHVHPRS